MHRMQETRKTWTGWRWRFGRLNEMQKRGAVARLHRSGPAPAPLRVNPRLAEFRPLAHCAQTLPRAPRVPQLKTILPPEVVEVLTRRRMLAGLLPAAAAAVLTPATALMQRAAPPKVGDLPKAGDMLTEEKLTNLVRHHVLREVQAGRRDGWL